MCQKNGNDQTGSDDQVQSTGWYVDLGDADHTVVPSEPPPAPEPREPEPHVQKSIEEDENWQRDWEPIE